MSLIKKAEDLPVKKIIIGAIYGQPGIGKSTMALSMPKPLLLDTDNGILRVQADYRCDSVPVENYQNILDVLKEDLSAYETIVIDTLGKLVDFMCEKIAQDNPNLVQKDGTMSIKMWGIVKNEFKNFLTIVQKMNKNLIFVAHEKESTENDVRIIRPDVSGSAGKDIIKDLDFLGYVEMVGKKRSISFTPSNKFYAKNSLQLDGYIEIPTLTSNDANTFLTDYILKPTIEHRKNEIKRLKENSEKMQKAIELVNKLGDTKECRDKLNSLGLNNVQVLKIKDLLQKK